MELEYYQPTAPHLGTAPTLLVATVMQVRLPGQHGALRGAIVTAMRGGTHNTHQLLSHITARGSLNLLCFTPF